MRVSVECSGKFAKFQKGLQPWELPLGATPMEVSELLGIDPKEVKAVEVNHKKAAINTILNPGDEVVLKS
jgi:hypothetical protein